MQKPSVNSGPVVLPGTAPSRGQCPICQDYLRDTVTTESGHNSCHPCIQQCWEDLQDIFPCPVCLQPCPDKGIRRNSQPCLMIDFVKNLPSTEDMRKWQKEKPLREKHRQVLSLFCEKDLELPCPQCRVSSEHHDHPLAHMEPASPLTGGSSKATFSP
eukprot:bmy_11013T0